MARPFSYSESDIHIPRLKSVSSAQRPLVDEAPLTHLELRIPSPPPRPKSSGPLNWSLRFLVHLTLIGTFETLFFWHYVGPSENTALSGLAQQYLSRTVSSCATLPPGQRDQLTTILDILLNRTVIDEMGELAAADRNAFNDTLLMNSWLYVLGLVLGTAVCGAGGLVRGLRIPWTEILGENLALVVLLGAYEAMFFNTVVFRYRTLSTPELDQMVVDEIAAAC